MNNFEFLNIINPQYVWCINCGIERNDASYMVVIPGLFGYQNGAGMNIYLTISDKLLEDSNNNGLIRLLTDVQLDPNILLSGYDDYVPGEDYFISESLYEYLINQRPVDNSSDSVSDDSSDDIEIKPRHQCYCGDNSTGIVILYGRDGIRNLNVNRINFVRIREILEEEGYYDKLNTTMGKIMHSQDLSEYLKENDIDVEKDDVDIIVRQRIVMYDYVLYNEHLEMYQNKDAYKWLFNINTKDMRNLEWFYKYNNMITTEFSSDDLCNLIRTFHKIILDNAFCQDPTSLNNQIYDKVIRFFANGRYDDTLIGLNLLLNSVTTTDPTSYRINCGCQSGNGNDNSTDLTNCTDLYIASMYEWLKKMLSDPDFYKDWFFIILSNMCPQHNTELIDVLIRLLTEYANDVIGDNFNPNTNYNIWNHSNCCGNNSTDNTYRNTILNYIEVLECVKNNDIDNNINKIRIYGEQFAEILPNLTC